LRPVRLPDFRPTGLAVSEETVFSGQSGWQLRLRTARRTRWRGYDGQSFSSQRLDAAAQLVRQLVTVLGRNDQNLDVSPSLHLIDQPDTF
jgi:hypothetical protein